MSLGELSLATCVLTVANLPTDIFNSLHLGVADVLDCIDVGANVGT